MFVQHANGARVSGAVLCVNPLQVGCAAEEHVTGALRPLLDGCLLLLQLGQQPTVLADNLLQVTGQLAVLRRRQSAGGTNTTGQRYHRRSEAPQEVS